jgi:hypothetical protein
MSSLSDLLRQRMMRTKPQEQEQQLLVTDTSLVSQEKDLQSLPLRTEPSPLQIGILEVLKGAPPMVAVLIKQLKVKDLLAVYPAEKLHMKVAESYRLFGELLERDHAEGIGLSCLDTSQSLESLMRGSNGNGQEHDSGAPTQEVSPGESDRDFVSVGQQTEVSSTL